MGTNPSSELPERQGKLGNDKVIAVSKGRHMNFKFSV